MADIIFDEDTLRDTAAALMVLNPRGHSHADGIVQHMHAVAEREQIRTPGYTGYLTTGGFELCFWVDDDGRMNVRASVMAYTVMRWLREQGKVR